MFLQKRDVAYEPARQNPDMFHGIGPFDIKTGKPTQKKVCPGYTDVFADALCQVAAEEEKLVAITAAMPDGTGLKKFSQRFPDRSLMWELQKSMQFPLQPDWHLAE